MFQPGSWLALDTNNQVVRDVRPGTLDAALALCGHGRVATFFGRLRAGVLAVDIDLADSAGVVMALSGWCAEKGLWHLVRQSGRVGHVHMFIVVGERAEQLHTFVAQLRAVEAVSAKAVEVRTAVRPLCAPHRCATTPALPRLAQAVRGLPAALAGLPAPTPNGPPEHRAGRVGVVAAVPVPIPARELPAAWAGYLGEGVVPPQVSGWADRSRSAIESTATFQMVAAGWTVQRAWMAVESAHPGAMGKARSRGRQWWTKHVWNVAVPAHTTQLHARRQEPSTPTPTTPDLTLTAHVQAWQAGFQRVWGSYGRDRRHTLRFVLDTIADRMIRTGASTIPCPERDLVMDTGITSRKTLRTALHQLHDDGWLVLHTTFTPGATEPAHQSHHVSLVWPHNNSTPDSPTPGPGDSARLSYPPSFFTPLPLRLRAHLGPELWHTLTALPPDHPATPDDLLAGAGLGARSRQTCLGRLNRLAALGLVTCDPHGRWHTIPPQDEVQGAAETSHATRCGAIAAERAEYELVRAGRGRWERQRRQAIEGNRTCRYQAARDWWHALPAAERTTRTTAYQNKYTQLSLKAQTELKDQLAQKRRLAGVVSEETIRQAWIESMPSQQYQLRATERAAAFAALPAPLRAARVAAWEDHRRRWGILRQSHPPLPQTTTTATQRQALIETQEVLALGTALERDLHGRLSGTPSAPGAATAVAG